MLFHSATSLGIVVRAANLEVAPQYALESRAFRRPFRTEDWPATVATNRRCPAIVSGRELVGQSPCTRPWRARACQTTCIQGILRACPPCSTR